MSTPPSTCSRRSTASFFPASGVSKPNKSEGLKRSIRAKHKDVNQPDGGGARPNAAEASAGLNCDNEGVAASGGRGREADGMEAAAPALLPKAGNAGILNPSGRDMPIDAAAAFMSD